MKIFNPEKSYCNDGSSGAANQCCFHHDMGYKNPEGRSRKEVDDAFLRCMKKNGLATKGRIMYAALRLGGWIRWNELRKRK